MRSSPQRPVSSSASRPGRSHRGDQAVNATPVGGGPGDPGLFNDVHGFLQSVAAEVEALRRHSSETDRARLAEIQDLRDLLERQRAERKDTISRLRYEFEEFVHTKVDSILRQIEDMKNKESGDDAQQQAQIDCIDKKVVQLKKNLYLVQNAWGKLISNYVNPETYFDVNEELRKASYVAEEPAHHTGVLSSSLTLD